jgi:hypothetical protein
MANHWHFVVWPRRSEAGHVSEVILWLTVTHSQRWHAHHGAADMEHAYHGRFKSFSIAADNHLVSVLYASTKSITIPVTEFVSVTLASGSYIVTVSAIGSAVPSVQESALATTWPAGSYILRVTGHWKLPWESCDPVRVSVSSPRVVSVPRHVAIRIGRGGDLAGGSAGRGRRVTLGIHAAGDVAGGVVPGACRERADISRIDRICPVRAGAGLVAPVAAARRRSCEEEAGME